MATKAAYRQGHASKYAKERSTYSRAKAAIRESLPSKGEFYSRKEAYVLSKKRNSDTNEAILIGDALFSNARKLFKVRDYFDAEADIKDAISFYERALHGPTIGAAMKRARRVRAYLENRQATDNGAKIALEHVGKKLLEIENGKKESVRYKKQLSMPH